MADLGGDQDGALADLDRDLDGEVENRESGLRGEVIDRDGRLHGEDEHEDGALGFGRKCEEILDRRWGEMLTLRGGLGIGYKMLEIVRGGARRQSLNKNLGGRGPKFLVRGRRYCWLVDARYGLFKQIGDLRNYLLNDHMIYEIWPYTHVMAPP